jgi:F-type H+-transporting ATPase subunit a
LVLGYSTIQYGQGHEGHDHGSHEESDHAHSGDDHHGAYDPAGTAIHHISDANVYSILDAVRIPLPMILKSDSGWDFFLSNKFDIGHHEDGHQSYNGYVMHHGSVYRVTDTGFPMEGSTVIDGFRSESAKVDGKDKDLFYAKSGGKEYKIDPRSTLDGGLLGGGITSFYDFSITKNVVSMILVCLFLWWLFSKAVKAYKKNPNKAPSGVQGLLEPIFLFIRDEVAIPFIGKDKYMKYIPLLMSIFFFILGLNLFGQIPFLGSINVTGNLTVTMIIAVIVFFIVNIKGNKDYWAHVFNMPGVPWFVKIILTPVEIMSLFIKPLTLMLRLAGNISAGHIAILSFIGLIFIFGDLYGGMGNGIGTVLAVPLTLFMMAIELIVAFVQAFVFCILTASYIGAAIEEHHHEGAH